MLGHYKAPLHRFFDPVARVLFRARVRPNHLTVLGLGVSIAAAYVFSRGSLRSGATLLAVAGLFAFFDGPVPGPAGCARDPAPLPPPLVYPSPHLARPPRTP